MTRPEMIDKHYELIKDGWIRRFTSEEPRLSEMKEVYKNLGFEVTVADGAPGEDGDCRSCFESPGLEGKYKTIYTRGQAVADDDELY